MKLISRLSIFVLVFVAMGGHVAGAKPTDSPERLTTPAPDSDAAVERILSGVVGIRALVPETARTAGTLGTDRQGTGVVINDHGLILTIGYLILEAEKAELVMQDGSVRPASLVAYDHNTGFGLLQANGPLAVQPATMGASADLALGAGVVSVAMGGPRPITPAQVVSRRAFAGYWEYLLEDAIFTAPPNPFFGGAALFDFKGHLVGIGSLVVNDAAGPGEPVHGNMFIPIDALKPIMKSMIETGRGPGPRHPWLGLYTSEARGRLVVMRVADGGPAAKAGIKAGDIIMGAGGRHVSTMGEFYRRVWSQGMPGAEVIVDLLPAGAMTLDIKKVKIRSMDRYDWLKMRR